MRPGDHCDILLGKNTVLFLRYKSRLKEQGCTEGQLMVVVQEPVLCPPHLLSFSIQVSAHCMLAFIHLNLLLYTGAGRVTDRARQDAIHSQNVTDRNKQTCFRYMQEFK